MKKLLPIIALSFLFLFSCKQKNKVEISAEKTTASNISSVLKTHTEFDVPQQRMAALPSNDSLVLTVPVANGSLILQLKKVDLNIVFETSSGNKFSGDGIQNYKGKILGDNTSFAAITIYEGEVSGFAVSENGSYVIGKLENNTQHIVYKTSDLIPNMPFECDVLEVPDSENFQRSELPETPGAIQARCPKFHWEIMNEIVVNKGGLNNTIAFINAIWNQVLTQYAADSIKIELSYVKIWDTADPYTGTSTSQLLTQFPTVTPTLNGDIGVLIGFRGGGGIAYLSVLCANSQYRRAYAGISASFQNVPTWSWTISVICHEQGHCIAARHTFACAYNGNNTPIDSSNRCWGFNPEGGCANFQLADPKEIRTIMSYAHGCPGGADFRNGFGTQIKAILINAINSASCVSMCSTNPADSCASIRVAPSITISTPQTNIPPNTNVTVTANPVNGGTKKRMDWYKNNIQDTAHSLTYSFVPVNGNTVRATLYNPDSCVTSHTAQSNVLTFVVTVVGGCSVPGGLATTNITSTSARPTWGSVSGYTAFQLQYRLKSTGSWTGKVTSNLYYTITGLTSNTDYEWQVKAVCGSSSSGFSAPQYFKTTGSGGTTPTISITKSPAGTTCANTSQTFSATTNAATGVNEWRIGGMVVGGNVTSISTDTMSRDATVVVTRSGITGMNGTTATNSLFVSITPSTLFFAALDQCTSTTIASNGTLTRTYTFSIKTLGGTNNSFQFRKNGTAVQTGTGTSYSTTNYVVGDEFDCIATNNRTCGTPKTITTNKIKIQ